MILFEGDGKFCDFVEKQLITIHPVTFEYETQSICDSLTYSLTGNQNIERVIGEFSKPYYLEINDAPDWYYLPETSKLTSGQKTILELTDELQDEALNQVNPLETMSMISTVIESLPEGDPVALILITRLYYMRGLNYELSHQEELVSTSPI